MAKKNKKDSNKFTKKSVTKVSPKNLTTVSSYLVDYYMILKEKERKV